MAAMDDDGDLRVLRLGDVRYRCSEPFRMLVMGSGVSLLLYLLSRDSLAMDGSSLNSGSRCVEQLSWAAALVRW